MIFNDFHRSLLIFFMFCEAPRRQELGPELQLEGLERLRLLLPELQRLGEVALGAAVELRQSATQRAGEVAQEEVQRDPQVGLRWATWPSRPLF